MARGTTRSRSTEETMASRVLDRWLGTGPLRRVLMICLWGLFLGGAVLALGLGVPELLERRAQTLKGTTGGLLLENPPDWFNATPQLAAELEHLALGAAGNDPTDRTGLVRAHAALQESGWFRELKRLHRRSDGTIVVEGTLVHPFAVVRWGNWDHLVDEDGNLLDWPYPSGSASPSLTLITGAETPPPTNESGALDFGRCWASARELEAGLALARVIEQSDWRAEIRSIDVSAYLDTRCLWLDTGTGPRISWGIAPDDLSASETSTSDKLRMLDWIHATHGDLNALPRTEIDIRHDVSTSKRVVSE